MLLRRNCNSTLPWITFQHHSENYLSNVHSSTNARIWKISSGFPGVLELPLWVRCCSRTERELQWEVMPGTKWRVFMCATQLGAGALPFLSDQHKCGWPHRWGWGGHPIRLPSWESFRTRGAHIAMPQLWHLPCPGIYELCLVVQKAWIPSCRNVQVNCNCSGVCFCPKFCQAMFLLFWSFQTSRKVAEIVQEFPCARYTSCDILPNLFYLFLYHFYKHVCTCAHTHTC